MSEIKVKYDGEYPNLCRGKLIVFIDNKKWVFPDYCLISGGNVSFDEDWREDVTEGEWSIDEWPVNFPEEIKEDVINKINLEIQHGCCGGCV